MVDTTAGRYTCLPDRRVRNSLWLRDFVIEAAYAFFACEDARVPRGYKRIYLICAICEQPSHRLLNQLNLRTM